MTDTTTPRYQVDVTATELRAIIQAVHKDRDWSPEPNILRPTERDALINRLYAELGEPRYPAEDK